MVSRSNFTRSGQIVPHLALAFNTEDAPFDLRSRQVGEHVRNISTDVRLCRERVERITV